MILPAVKAESALSATAIVNHCGTDFQRDHQTMVERGRCFQARGPGTARNIQISADAAGERGHRSTTHEENVEMSRLTNS
jgi:hypothetical protein